MNVTQILRELEMQQLSDNEIPEALAMLESLRARLFIRLATPRGSTADTNGMRLLKVEAAAERVSLTPEYLYELIRQGRFPSVKIGKYVLVDPNDIPNWIEAHRNKIIDNQPYVAYASSHDRRRTQTDQKADGTYASRIRGPRRRSGKLDCKAGTERDRDTRTAGEINTTPGRTAQAVKTEPGNREVTHGISSRKEGSTGNMGGNVLGQRNETPCLRIVTGGTDRESE
jgi:excisionase family DNA binding protein